MSRVRIGLYLLLIFVFLLRFSILKGKDFDSKGATRTNSYFVIIGNDQVFNSSSVQTSDYEFAESIKLENINATVTNLTTLPSQPSYTQLPTNENIAMTSFVTLRDVSEPARDNPFITVLPKSSAPTEPVREVYHDPTPVSVSTSMEYPTYFPSPDLRLLPATHPSYEKTLYSNLSPKQKELLNSMRQLYKPIKADVPSMLAAFEKGFKPLEIFDSLPRSSFYTISRANTTHSIPSLMDTFSYCERNSLVVEIILNVKYVFKSKGKSKGKEVLEEKWHAVYDGEIATNELPSDYHRHSILGLFRFPEKCSNGSHTFDIFSMPSYYHYHIQPVHLPHFTEPRYYLSACTSIDKSPADQVKAWINYNYFHGVEHFTIYLNDRESSWRSILSHYVEKGLLDLIDFSYIPHRTLFEQASALNSCNRRYRYASKLVVYNDVDEYFLPKQKDWRLVDVVRLYEETFPSIDAFRVYSTFHACKNYSYSYWKRTNNLKEICPYRWRKVVRGIRFKNFVRPASTPIVQVHEVCYARNSGVDAGADMVMLHFKMGCNRRPAEEYFINSLVEEGMRHAFYCVCMKHAIEKTLVLYTS